MNAKRFCFATIGIIFVYLLISLIFVWNTAGSLFVLSLGIIKGIKLSTLLNICLRLFLNPIFVIISLLLYVFLNYCRIVIYEEFGGTVRSLWNFLIGKFFLGAVFFLTMYSFYWTYFVKVRFMLSVFVILTIAWVFFCIYTFYSMSYWKWWAIFIYQLLASLYSMIAAILYVIVPALGILAYPLWEIIGLWIMKKFEKQ